MPEGTLIDVRLAELVDGPNVRRKADPNLRSSVRRYGVLQPIAVSRLKEGYQVLWGHRRVAAARAAGLSLIPAVLIDKPRDLGIRQLIENVDRKALDPLEIAEACRKALEDDPNLTQEVLAMRLGRKPAYVSNKLALLRLSEDVQARIRAGDINEHVAIKQRPRTDDGRGRPRIIPLEADVERGNSASVVVNFDHGKATIGVDRDERHVELILTDQFGRSTTVVFDPHEAKLLGRRLHQAYEATA